MKTSWSPGRFYKFLNQDGKTLVIIEVLSEPKYSYIITNKFWFNKKDSIYYIEFNKIFTGLNIEATEISRKDVFIELFK